MSIFNDIYDLFKNKDDLKNDIGELMKSDADDLPEKPEEHSLVKDSIGRQAIIDDPYFDFSQNHFIFKSKQSRIANRTLKDVSLRDWLVSSIMQCRVDTMIRFSRPQINPQKMEMGYKIIKRDNSLNTTDEEQDEIMMLEDFIYNCGRKDKVPGFDKMLFSDMLKMCTRDALTFGHVGIEKIHTRKGGLHRFRPIPAESLYRVNEKTSQSIIEREMKNARKSYEKSRFMSNDPRVEPEINKVPIEYYKYVQMSYDNQVLAAFGEEDMIFKLFNPQNFADSLGYCYSLLELSVINVTNHMNVENYNSQFFTAGYAARGILHLKGTVTQQQLSAFRRQFYNTINGTQNAWRTPIIGGLDQVDWIPMSGSAKEMEYLQYNDHIMRAVCSQFQIDPTELGMEYLSRGTTGGSRTGMTGEEKIQNSRERGLLPILMFFEDMINCDIIPALDKDLANKYKFKFTGYTDESPQSNVALLQAEMTVHSSMNDLLKSAYKIPMKQEIADLPLNQAFWQLVEKNYTKGEIREYFFGDKGASLRRELAYFPADPAFMGWQQLLLTIDSQRKQQEQMQQQQETQQQQVEAQKQQQDSENIRADAEHSREQEKHDAEMKEIKARHLDAVKKESLKESAKKYGFADKALDIDGKTIKNPINDPLAE